MTTLAAELTERYLHRIGAERPEAATPEALRYLHERHLASVPFENLDVALGRRFTLDPDALTDKIVTRRRGGFCYELNGLFALLLDALGFEVTRCGATVSTGGPPLDHLALLVRCDDGSQWLADVGFGRHARHPLRWEFGVAQPDPNGEFRLERADCGDVDVFDGPERAYRLELHPRELGEFEAMCWYQQTSPDSHFTQSVVCSLDLPDERVSLSGDRLITSRGDGRTEQELGDDATILETYRSVFGIELETVPRRPQPA